MKPTLAVLFFLIGPVSARGASLEYPVWRAGAASHPVPGYRGDRLTLQLRPQAARAVYARAARAPASAVGVASIDQALAALGARIHPEFRGETPPAPGSTATDFTAFYIVDLPPGAELGAALDRFGGLADVAHASPIGLAPVAAVPNDSMWATSWHFYQASRRDIHAPEAWDLIKGDTSIVVAIIDTGLLPYHPDIGGSTPGSRGQIVTNWAEANGRPGVDDDGNGFVDDVAGWDFVALADSSGVTFGEDWRDEDNDPNDYVGHGTNVAGLVGALNDNHIGVAGTAWNVRLMPLRVGWSMQERQTGVVDMGFLAEAVRYATRMGAKVINISLSTTALLELDLAVSDAIASGVTVVVAAGNNGSPNGLLDRPGLIRVTATDRNDVIPPWANVGADVDFAAPGAEIATTGLTRTGTDSLSFRQPWYVPDANGTSFAAPIASGAVALLQAQQLALKRPLLTPEQVRLTLMGACDDISAQNPNASGYYGAGRLNLQNALLANGSFRAAQLAAAPVGAPVEYQSSNGARRVALQTSDGTLSFLDAETLERVGGGALGAAPTGDLAAAELGEGRGLGFFATVGDHQVVGLGGGGAPLPGWPVAGSGTSMTPPALGDLDGDGRLDVVCVSRDASGFGVVWAWDEEGRLRAGFPVSIGHFLATGARPALGDLDGAPGLEIVVADADGWVRVIRSNGNPLSGWPVHLTGTPYASPAITRQGSIPEVVVINRSEWHLLGSNGLTTFPLLSALRPFDPVLADLNDDGVDDVLVTTSDATRVWYLGSGPPGTTSWPVIPVGRSFLEPPVVGHLTAAPGFEIMIPTTTAPVLLGRDGAMLPNLSVRTQAVRPTLAAPIHASRTVAYLSSAPSAFLSVDLADSSWSAVPQPWPTSRANFARTGSRWGPPSMVAADDRPPGTVTDLEAVAKSQTSIRLTWKAPPDEGPFGRAIAYDVKMSDGPIPDAAFGQGASLPGAPVPRAAGLSETLLVNVAPGPSSHYFRLRAQDGSGNWSVPSNETVTRTPTSVPDSVTDVRATAANESTLVLQWTATGGDGWVGRPARYVVALSPLPMTAIEFGRSPFRYVHAATADAGAPESLRVEGLPSDTRYRAALVAVDEEGFVSGLSNVAEGITPPFGAHVDDRDPPSAILDLKGEVLDLSRARLTWSAPSDDAALDRAALYDLRESIMAITADNFETSTRIPFTPWPRLAGAAETLSIQAPPAGVQYYALRSMDPAGHWSDLSNGVQIRAPSSRPASIGDLEVVAVTESTVALRWSTGRASDLGQAASYVIGVSPSPLTFANFGGAPYRFYVARTAPAEAPESTVVGRLPRWSHFWIAMRAVSSYGIESDLSNQVEAQTLTAPDQPFALELGRNPTTPPVHLRWSTGRPDPSLRPTLSLLDVGGRRIRTFDLGHDTFGIATWDGTDTRGRRVPAGVYFAAFSTASRRAVVRFVLLP